MAVAICLMFEEQALCRALARAPSRIDELRQFLSFAGRALDVFGGWTGDIPASAVIPTDLATLRRAAADPRGALLVVAHLGNVDLSRAVLDPATRPFTHQEHARLGGHVRPLARETEVVAPLIEPAPPGTVRVDGMAARNWEEDEILVMRPG